MLDRGDASRNAMVGVELASSKSSPRSTMHPQLDQRGFYLAVGKRLIDIVISSFGLILFAPILLIVGGLIKLSSPGPALFRQQRVGKNERLFWILKFRTMVEGAERTGGGITPRNDPRVTPLGVFLRKWKLDELPQLWNVLKGEMSVVGPRPELPSYVAEYTSEQKAVLLVKPGITDPGSLRYRDEGRLLQQNRDPQRLYREKILPDKLALNLQYLKDISFARDLHLIVSTIKSVIGLPDTSEFD